MGKKGAQVYGRPPACGNPPRDISFFFYYNELIKKTGSIEDRVLGEFHLGAQFDLIENLGQARIIDLFTPQPDELGQLLDIPRVRVPISRP